MIWNLMGSTYKDGNPVPDHEIANIMIGLLMAGQHNSYSVASWILFHIADRLDIQEALFQEQLVAFGSDLDTSSSHSIINRLPLHKMVVQETLRIHDPIHTMMRAIKAPLTIVSHHQPTLLDRVYRIPTSHILVAAPGITARSEEFFPDPTKWDPYRWQTIPDVLSSSEKDMTGQTPLSKGSASFFLPFGAGRHRCVGETFSYLQLSVMIAYLIRNFKFRPLPGAEFPKPDYSAMITRPILPARLRWERRVKI
jgi:sterol 14-demethylase